MSARATLLTVCLLAGASSLAAAAPSKAEIERLMTRGNGDMTRGAKLLAAGKRADAKEAFAAGARRYEEALASLVAVKELRQPARLGFWINANWNLACAHALLGEPEPALDAFERVLSAGFDTWIQLRRERDLDAIRELPRFKAMLRLAKTAQGLRREYRPQLERKVARFPYALRASDVRGRELDLAKLAGRLVLVHVAKDLRALDELRALQRMYAGRLRVVALVHDPKPDAAARWRQAVERKGVDFPLVLASAEQLDAAKAGALPTTLFVDKASRVRFHGKGPLSLAVKWLVVRLLDLEEAN